MNPSDLQPKTELAAGGALTTVSLAINWLVLHWQESIGFITLISTCIGALCGAIVGVHAVYRIKSPKPRSPHKRDRATDRE